MSIPTDELRRFAAGDPKTLPAYAVQAVCDELLACREERDAARAELAALRGRDAKPFDWDGVPTVEGWIAENLRKREPRAGSRMVELHPDEVVADRGESRRVAGWLKDLLAELAAVKRQRDELVRIGKETKKALHEVSEAGYRAFELAKALAAEQPKPQQPEVQP